MANTTLLDTWYSKLSKWYLSRPWYLKVLFVGAIIAIVVLFLLRFFVKSALEEYQTNPPKDIPSDPSIILNDDEVTYADRTSGLKRQLLEQVKNRELDKEKFEQQVTSITDAQTMEELHAIREKYNL